MRTISLCALTLVLGASLATRTGHAQELTPPVPTPPATSAAPPPAPAPAPPSSAYAQPAAGQPVPYYAPYPGMYTPPGTPPRPRMIGYRTEERSVKGIWVPGLVMFLGGWVLNFGVATPIANALSNDRDSAIEQDAWAWSLVPIAGPLVELGLGAPHPAIPLVMFAIQGAGLAMLIAGLVMKEDVRIAVYEGDPNDPNATRLDLAAYPIEGGAQIGLTLTHL